MNKISTLNGKDIYEHHIYDGSLEAVVLNYGATIKSLMFTKANGEKIDIVLGYNTIDEYIKNDGFFGSIVGRVANRISGGKFKIDDKEYNLDLNDGCNSAHGGFSGFDKMVFDIVDYTSSKIVLRSFSKDGDQGFPGNISLRVIIEINKVSGIVITYEALSDKDTIVNLINHSYFNLNGEDSGSCLDTFISIDANEYTPINENLCPYNEIKSVDGTIYDFKEPKQLIQDFDLDDKMLGICGGFDLNYVINGSGFRKMATAYSSTSNIQLDLYSNLPGMQLYTGNFISYRSGKTGFYDKWSGFCLEAQNFPNSINCPNFPSVILRKGKLYSSVIEYRVSERIK